MRTSRVPSGSARRKTPWYIKLHVPPVKGLRELQAYGVPSSSCLTLAKMASAVSRAMLCCQIRWVWITDSSRFGKRQWLLGFPWDVDWTESTLDDYKIPLS